MPNESQRLLPCDHSRKENIGGGCLWLWLWGMGDLGREPFRVRRLVYVLCFVVVTQSLKYTWNGWGWWNVNHVFRPTVPAPCTWAGLFTGNKVTPGSCLSLALEPWSGWQWPIFAGQHSTSQVEADGNKLVLPSLTIRAFMGFCARPWSLSSQPLKKRTE